MGAQGCLFFCFLHPQSRRKRKVPSWGWIYAVLVVLTLTSAQVMGAVGSRISPKGDHASPPFMESLDGVKGRDFVCQHNPF